VQDGAIELDRRQGRIDVAPAALASAAVRVVLDCAGVVGMASPKLKHGKPELLGDHHANRGVSLSFHGESIALDIYVVIEYGTRISALATTIINSVREALGQMLGPVPLHVTVHVQGLQVVG
jgi:uncharacterized alkaline shock family protein YloU